MLGRGGQLLAAGGDVLGRRLHIHHHLFQFGDHGGQGLHQFIVVTPLIEFDRQVALGHLFGVGGNAVGCLDQDVQVVLDPVEVAVISVGDHLGHIALGDPVDMFGRHIQGADDRIQGVVDPGHDLLKVALVFGRIRSDCKLTFNRRC